MNTKTAFMLTFTILSGACESKENHQLINNSQSIASEDVGLNEALDSVLIKYLDRYPKKKGLSLCIEINKIVCDTTFITLYSTYNDNLNVFPKSFEFTSNLSGHKIFISSGINNIIKQKTYRSIENDSIRLPIYNPKIWLIAVINNKAFLKDSNFVSKPCNKIELHFSRKNIK